MIILARLWHEYVLGHEAWQEIDPAYLRSRRYGTIIECNCGTRWLSRAPWDRIGL